MKPPAVQFRGGLRWGNFNATWPFAVMRIEGDLLTLICFGKQKRFRRKQLLSAEIRRGFSPGIRIRHRKAIYPRDVIFWTWQPEGVREALQRFLGRG